MSRLETELLYSVTIQVGEMQDIGNTYRGHRNIVKSSGGTFEGPRLKGRVLPGGGDWFLTRPDGIAEGDVRDTYETDDGHLIYVHYRAIMDVPEAVWRRILKNEPVDPSEYYFKATPCFETGSDKYGWLNRIVAVASGRFMPGGLSYEVLALL